jgi:hypothetical protein
MGHGKSVHYDKGGAREDNNGHVRGELVNHGTCLVPACTNQIEAPGRTCNKEAHYVPWELVYFPRRGRGFYHLTRQEGGDEEPKREMAEIGDHQSATCQKPIDANWGKACVKGGKRVKSYGPRLMATWLSLLVVPHQRKRALSRRGKIEE